MIALLACRQDPVPRDGPVPPEGESGLDTAAPGRPAFVAPAEAEDLDPAAGVVRVALTAAPHAYTVGGLAVDGWAYDAGVPGPTLRADVGDRLVVELTNALPDPTTIHWHGLSVPYAMDGVTWRADPVPPGGTFTYDFVLTRPGTFWYHPHFDADGQLDRGLYGMLIVEDPDEPATDREVLLVLDDWTESLGDDPHGLAPFPATWAVNGVVGPELVLRGGETVRVRILNASNTRYLDLRGMRWIGGDQGLLPAPVEPADVLLAPGDRAELEWLVGAEGFTLRTEAYTLDGGVALGEAQELLTVAVQDGAPAPPPIAWPVDPTPPASDPGATDITWVFSGEGDAWLIDGEKYPDVTIETLALGQEAVIEVRNLSATEHPFHLHGHAFEVLSAGGVAPGWRRVEDTVNVRIREAVRLKLVADNPGDWMAHCHVLPHAHDGMMTVLRVGP